MVELTIWFAVTELATSLSNQDVKKFISFLKPPEALFQDVTSRIDFMYALQKWQTRDPQQIFQGLSALRPDLVSTAQRIDWLSMSTERKKLNPIQSLIKILKTEMIKDDWKLIGANIPTVNIESKVEANLHVLATEGYITHDLQKLITLFTIIKRNDIATKLQVYQNSFSEMSEKLFIINFKKELIEKRELEDWEVKLMKFITTQNKKVKQLIDDDEEVPIESIFVPLTVVEHKPREVKLEDETTYSEIAYLRQIANKEIDVELIDFKEEFTNYDPSANTPEIWCLIGNPGSGKTFLCHRTALRFGRGELSQFSYSLSIPCRHSVWHQMENSRVESGAAIDGDFIQSWLCISMPVGPSWTTDLAKHILDSDGDGLLLIVDSLDEYTKLAEFETTLLFLLLTRKCLSQCTILLTSRPGAYTIISSKHDLNIDRFFHVLGFSPENRNLYFSLQLTEEGKLEQLQGLLYLHEEMKQLSLVPVNASLFAALVRGSDNVTAFTLTQLYSELVAYLIRRQLSRMGLKEMAKKRPLFNLHPNVLDCLFRIGQVAYLGVSSRQLTATDNILLKVDKVEKACQCLGLAEEHIKTNQMGEIIRVWSFTHLTIQEFVGAIWLKMCSRGDQCLSTRYIVNSSDNFSIFKMVVRFLCGLLSHGANHVLHLLYKYLPTHPMSMQHMPMKYQLNYSKELPEHMGCIEFTQKFVLLSEMLLEPSSKSILQLFSYYRDFLPKTIYLYFESATSPNEWECFMRSLHLLTSIQLIYFDTRYVTIIQFRSLLTNLTSSTLSHLAVRLYDQDYPTLLTYSDVIKEYQLPSTISSISTH